ncbi:ATP-binding protein [Nocardioides sp. HM23]|uniref:sensor histidine kinase n=1 Tax=Nocardioides bizhenqiangii TaxID=3095076 RepID=UPI002ACA8F34|nr:ATP-binding protein [Nocardioides sp. HM23]MDZ5622513.1 ATP-binding protein [Nocardioides sp. HM23]
MRTRITLAVALLVALALTGSGAIVYLIEHDRNREQVADEVEQEVEEFRTLQRTGIDPRTGKAFDGVVPLLQTFLDRNVASPSEAFLAWYDGDALPGQEPGDDAYLGDEEFDRIVEELTPGNGSRLWTSPRDGEVLIAVQSVQFEGDNRVGALVVVQELSERDALLNETMRTYAIVAFLSLLLVLAIGWWQSGRLLSPLRTLRTTAERIGATDLSQRLPVRGHDDITDLTHTVNGMLERLESAFISQKRFLDDAGHELRTPLTVLSGHLELLDTANPDEVEATRKLLLDEVDRMARLTRDLILLAKSDRPDFLRIEQVDLDGLAEDLVAKARGLGEREWRYDGAPAGRVEMDRQRITQAVLQLADNAVKHTQEGDEIAIGAAVSAESVTIWVRDSGPGVPAADRELIFERFGRGVVRENDEGFGLGLSIVRAIATGHGGTAHVENAPSGGARFVLTLPIRQTRPKETNSWPAS